MLSGCGESSRVGDVVSSEQLAQVALAHSHAHNDYEHARPLFDALDNEFASVEADVYTDPAGLTDLYVAHDPQDIQPARTLRALYLDPLAQRVRDHGGSVYGDGSPFHLLIDIKTEAESTYARVDQQLREYAFMLSSFTPDGMTSGAVTVVISGNRPAGTMRAQAQRFAGYDGRLSDLDSADPPSFMPLISDNWTTTFSWNGAGPMPADQRATLREYAGQAHAAGRRLRLWDTPDADGVERAAVWHELLCAGVDHLNTDDLAGLRDYLLANDPPDGCD
jgi:hypothetical protein